jgi:hypothetical protein
MVYFEIHVDRISNRFDVGYAGEGVVKDDS